MAKSTLNDIFGISLLLVGIFIFLISLNEIGLIKYIGIIGSISLIIVESVFLWRLVKRNLK